MIEIPDSPSFEEVFGFANPTDEQIKAALKDLSDRLQTGTPPWGTMAFFSHTDLREASMEAIQEMAESSLEAHDVSLEDATELVYSGFIVAMELMAAVQQRRE